MIAAPSYYEAVARGLTPPPDWWMDEWADERRQVPAASSPEPGQWRTSRVPYAREPMREMSPQSPTKEIVLMWGSQLCKTEIMINGVLYTMDVDPVACMYVAPTIDMAEKNSKSRFTPSIQMMPTLFDKVVERQARFRDINANTILAKNFPGGVFYLTGANSASGLSSYPIGRLFLDEIDRYPQDLDKEGDPVELAVRRTANYANRKIVYASTPGITGFSRIEALYEAGDQRHYFVMCPKCGRYQLMTWARIIWTRGDYSNVCLECEGCNAMIEERYKTEMLDSGYWKAEFPHREVASFHLSALYSPLGFYSWRTAARKWDEAHEAMSQEARKAFINTVLAETWSIEGKEVDVSEFVTKRREVYDEEVPDGVLLLTAGVDVQGDRIEAEVVGWGVGEETWSIDYKVLLGDTAMQAVWDELDQYLLGSWQHEYGHRMNIAAVGVDASYRSKVVYDFCAARVFRRFFAIKGREGIGNGYVKRMSNTKNAQGAYAFIAFVDEIKRSIYSKLRVTDRGPGFCHFPKNPKYDKNHFLGLTAEKEVVKRVEGKVRYAWLLPKGRRNEQLDCRSLNTSAFTILGPNMDELRKLGKPYSPDYTLASGRGRRRPTSGVDIWKV